MVSRYAAFTARAEATWHAYTQHPWFVTLADGTITDEQFVHFVLHDKPYVDEFQQAQLRIAAGFADLAAWLPALELIAHESELEGRLLAGFGHLDLDPVRDRWDVCPSREAYMNHLYLAASQQDPALGVASILPCGAGFGEIAAWLSERRRPDEAEHIRLWLDFYCRAEQWDYSKLLVDLFEAATGISRSTVDEQYRYFLRSLQHQIRVLDAAYRLDDVW